MPNRIESRRHYLIRYALNIADSAGNAVHFERYSSFLTLAGKMSVRKQHIAITLVVAYSLILLHNLVPHIHIHSSEHAEHHTHGHHHDHSADVNSNKPQHDHHGSDESSDLAHAMSHFLHTNSTENYYPSPRYDFLKMQAHITGITAQTVIDFRCPLPACEAQIPPEPFPDVGFYLLSSSRKAPPFIS